LAVCLKNKEPGHLTLALQFLLERDGGGRETIRQGLSNEEYFL